MRAEESRHNRVVGGDHYAADLVATKQAAAIVIGNMIGNAKFQGKFAAAKTELRKLLSL